MAAPTNVDVESNSPTQAAISWTYGGTGVISVFRAPHGGSFSEVTSAPSNTRVPAGTTIYYDNTVSAGVFYDYKLSDDGGSTFSSVVSVVIQVCVPTNSSNQSTTGPGLPQFVDDAAITAEALNQLSHQVEVSLSAALAPPGYCVICSSNGAVVLDCTSGCQNFWIITTEDINSISNVGCVQDGTISFIIPANTTRKIKGWAVGSSLQQAMAGNGAYTITAGSKPLQAEVHHYCKCDSRIYGNAYIVLSAAGVDCVCDDRADGSSDVAQSGATQAGSTGCSPTGGLTLVATKADGSTPNTNYSMQCSSANKGMQLQACGGVPPYTWTFTGNINFVGSSIGRATAFPVTNSGSGVSGIAYGVYVKGCIPSLAAADYVWQDYNCNDSANGVIQDAVASAPVNCPDAAHQITCASLNKCKGTDAEPGNCNCGDGNFPGTTGTAPTAYCNPSGGTTCDKRTALMVTNGCAPCGITAAGATITVKDSLGTQVTIVLRA